MNNFSLFFLLIMTMSTLAGCKQSNDANLNVTTSENDSSSNNGGNESNSNSGNNSEDTLHPPGYQVKKAYINIFQGSEIYGNGLMQSIVRVNYELKKGATLESITLQEFGTGRELSSVGWNVSDSKNNFDHNIGRTRRNVERPPQKMLLTYIDKYVSTKRSNENIDICFEITSRLKNVTGTYSTCDGEGFSKGTVKLFAYAPIVYTGTDFNVVYLMSVFASTNSVYTDMWGTLYALRRTENIPPDLTFTVDNESVIPFSSPNFEPNQSRTFIANYIRDYAGDITDNAMTYSGVYLLRAGLDKDTSGKNKKTDYKFTYLIDGPMTKETLTLRPYDYDGISLFLRVTMNWGRTQYKNYRCLMNGSYRCWDGKTTSYTYFDKKTADIKNSSVLFKELTPIDNYGTKHPLFLYFNQGSSTNFFLR